MSSRLFIDITIAFGIFTDSFTYSIVLPFYPNLIKQIGGSNEDVGFILAFFSIGLIIGSVFFGFYSDMARMRKPLMLGGLCLLIQSTLLMVFIRTYWSLCLGRFLQGLASGSIWVVGMALIADTCLEKDLGFTMACVFTGCIAGQLVGPIVGGILYEYGPNYPYWAVIALASVDFVLRIFMKEPPPRDNEIIILKRTPKEIMMALARNKCLWLLLTLNGVCGFVIGSTEVVFTLQLQSLYQLSSSKIGLSFLALAIPQTLTNPFGGWIYDRFGYRAVGVPGLLATSAAFFILIINLSLPIFLVVFGAMAAISMFSFSAIFPEISKVVDIDCYGASYGITKCAFALGLLAGSAIGAVLFQYAGFGIYCLCMGGIMILSVPLVLLDRTFKRSSNRTGDSYMG